MYTEINNNNSGNGFEEAVIENNKPSERSISEQLDEVVRVDETQKNIWVLYSLIAKELGINKKSDLKKVIEATVEHYEKHKKIMAEYEDVMKKTRG